MYSRTSSTDLQEIVQVVLWSQGTHSGPIPRTHLLHKHLHFVQLQYAFGPRKILEMLSKSNQSWKNFHI